LQCGSSPGIRLFACPP